jgi:hypothetical protein
MRSALDFAAGLAGVVMVGIWVQLDGFRKSE